MEQTKVGPINQIRRCSFSIEALGYRPFNLMGKTAAVRTALEVGSFVATMRFICRDQEAHLPWPRGSFVATTRLLCRVHEACVSTQTYQTDNIMISNLTPSDLIWYLLNHRTHNNDFFSCPIAQWRADTCECPGLTRTKLLDWMPLPRPKSSFITNLLIGWPPPYRDPVDAQDDRPLSLPIYAPLSIRRLYVVRISSVCLYVFCMLSVYRLYVVCMSSVCLLYVFCMSSVCQLYVVCMSSVCRLYVACMSSVCRLYVLCMSSLSSVCLLYVVCMFTYGVFMSFGCRQYAVCMSSVCFM